MGTPSRSKRGGNSQSVPQASQQIKHLSGRVSMVDAARGMAVVLMVCFHFCFDLNYFNLANFDFYRDSFWLTSRALIVSLFMFIVGVSLQLACSSGLKKGAYVRRLGVLAGCAAVVSAASYVMFPDSGIFFGVLHFIFAASLLGLLFCRLYYINLFLGLGWILAGLTYKNPWFDQVSVSWIGFVTYKPITQDYAPLFPWFGVVLLGMFAGRLLSSHETAVRVREWKGSGGAAHMLTWLGRNSLAVYMLHQPLLLAVLYVVTALMHK